MSQPFCLYSIRNLLDGKQYIGQTKRVPPSRRWKEHRIAAARGDTTLPVLYAAMRKHGENNFVFEQHLLFRNQEELNAAEIHLIEVCGTRASGGAGYNVTAGGDSGRTVPHSPETLAKMRAVQGSPEARARKSAYQTGRKYTPEARATMKAVQSSPEAIAWKVKGLTGIKRSPETLAKMKVIRASPEYKAKLSESHRGKKLSPEHKAILLAACNTPEANAKKSASHLRRHAQKLEALKCPPR